MNGRYDPTCAALKYASPFPSTPTVSFLLDEHQIRSVLQAQVEERIFRLCGDVPNGASD